MKKRFTLTMMALALTAQASQAAIAAMEPIHDAVARIAGYRFGDSREPLTVVEDMAREALSNDALRDALTAALVDLLGSEATYESKDFACRQLAIIGGPAAVPALAALLRIPDTADMARYALQAIPCPEANQALLDALGSVAEPVQIGIINSLGERRDAASVAMLASYAMASDPALAEAAIHALGKIGNTAALDALLSVQPHVAPVLRRAVADALILCAEELAIAGETHRAATVFESLFDPAQPATVRIAAFQGLVVSRPDTALMLLIDVLTGADAALYGPAVAALSYFPDTDATKAVAHCLGKMAPDAQEMLLYGLGERGDGAALKSVVAMVGSDNQEVRIAALTALGSLGDGQTAHLLARTAAQSEGRERQAARNSLYAVQALCVDTTVIRGIRREKAALRIEYIRAASERGIKDAKPALYRAAKARRVEVRNAAYRALTNLAGDGDLNVALSLLHAAKRDAGFAEAEKFAAAAAARTRNTEARDAALDAALKTAKKEHLKAAIQRIRDGLATDRN